MTDLIPVWKLDYALAVENETRILQLEREGFQKKQRRVGWNCDVSSPESDFCVMGID